MQLTDDVFLVFDEERLGGGTEERDALASRHAIASAKPKANGD